MVNEDIVYPSVGRIVHVYKAVNGEWCGPYAAIVTDAVDGYSRIDACVFRSGVMPLFDVPYSADDRLSHSYGWHWRWPPRV